MRTGGRTLLLTLALVLAALPGQAALSRPHAFALEDSFAPYGAADSVAFASGRLEAALPAAQSAHAFFNASGRIDGLAQVCWGYEDPTRDCVGASLSNASLPGAGAVGGAPGAGAEGSAPDGNASDEAPSEDGAADGALDVAPGGGAAAGNLSLRVLGGGVGLRFPGNVSADVEARQAIAMFLSLGDEGPQADLGMDRVLVAPVVGGVVRFGPVPEIPPLEVGLGFEPERHKDEVGLLATLDAASHVEVLRDGQPIHTLRGRDVVVSFTGAPAAGPMSAETLVLGFPDGAAAEFRPADAADAQVGLDVCRIDAALRRLGDAAAGAEAPPCTPAAADVQALMQEILNGAIVLVPVPENQTQVDLGALGDGVLVRFRGMTTTASGGTLAHVGSAMLQIEDGEVHGTPELYGFWVVQMPWWAWLLWGLAVAALVARLVTKAPKANERWDGLGWVGLVVGVLALALVVWLWDREIAAALGTSAFTTQASGAGMWTVAAIEAGAFAFLSAFFVAPLGMLFRNVAMLAGQGKFMNLSIPAGLLVGFLAGAHLVRAYLGVLLAQGSKVLGA